MKSALIWLSPWLLTVAAMCQDTWYAPDLRVSAARDSWLGIVNPQLAPVDVTVTGYDTTGQVIDSVTLAMKRFEHIERHAMTWFGEDVAWARIEANELIAGYVRHQRTADGRFSLTGLVPFSGMDAYVAQLNPLAGIGRAEVVLANVSDQSGTMSLKPSLQTWFDPVPILEDEPIALDANPYGQIEYQYPDFYDLEKVHIYWDQVFAKGGPRLAGVQHLGGVDEEGGFATYHLPRTPLREMIIAPYRDDAANSQTRFVLANTYPVKLPIELTAYYEHSDPLTTTLELEPYEHRIFNFNDHSQILLASNALWYRLRTQEGGVLGFQLYEPYPGGPVAASEANHLPGNIINLPYTPTDSSLQTTLHLINPSDETALLHFAGFDQRGKIVELLTMEALGPLQQRRYTLEEIFGDDAEDIVWTRVWTRNGELWITSLTEQRDGTGLAVMDGIPIKVNQGPVFHASFEQFTINALEGQGWQGFTYDARKRRSHLLRIDRNHHHDDYHTTPPGSFFLENAFLANHGNLYLGYDPLLRLSNIERSLLPDTVVYLSPPVEIPNYGEFHVSFAMRFMKPQQATEDSEYGIVIVPEEEGDWTWFGLDGKTLLDPPPIIADCWRDLNYRSLAYTTTVSDWLPFETKLPEQYLGKRVRVGLYFNHQPAEVEEGPLLAIDDIRIQSEPLRRSIFFESGFGIIPADTFALPNDEEDDE